MNGGKRPLWLIIAVLAGLTVMALVIFRARPAPVVSPIAGQPASTAPSSAASGTNAGAPAQSAHGLTSTSGPDDWAMEGYNPARTRSIEAGVALPFTQQRALAVSGDTGDGSPLTIAHGVILIESPHRLRALDLSSGAERWSLPLDGVYISPAVAGNTVFVRSEADNKGQMLALDIASGKQRWAFRPRRLSSASNGYFGGHLTSPVVVGGTVFLGAGKEVYALDAATGAQRWQFAAQDYISSSATVADGRIYIADFAHLYSIDQQTGVLAWAFPTTNSIYFSPVVAGQTVLLTNGDQLVALDTASGKPRWNLSIPGEELIPGAAQGSRVFAKSTSTLYALELASGSVLWQAHNLNFISLPVVAGDQVFVVSGMGADTAVSALDATTGRGTWKQSVASLATAAPVIAGQSLYVRTTDGRVLGFWH
ncbi:MAG TPA: PQQ-binding-like beta-propeller repeat protein [Roseiflexaceae bacterium]|jgi:outer membrane protein assembly factor BamB